MVRSFPFRSSGPSRWKPPVVPIMCSSPLANVWAAARPIPNCRMAERRTSYEMPWARLIELPEILYPPPENASGTNGVPAHSC